MSSKQNKPAVPQESTKETQFRNMLLRNQDKTLARSTQGNALICFATQQELDMLQTTVQATSIARDSLIIDICQDMRAKTNLACYGVPLMMMIERKETNMFLATLILRFLPYWSERVEWPFQMLLVWRNRESETEIEDVTLRI